MFSSTRGYTVFEVMVVLSVSSVILLTALFTFKNQQPKTEYNQAMNDLQSRFQKWATDVSSGTFPGTTSYSCAPTDLGQSPPAEFPHWRPGFTFHATQTPQSTSQDCVYIGKAVHVVIWFNGSRSPTTANTKNSIYIYNVFGFRNVYSGSTTTTRCTGQPDPDPALRIQVTNFLQSCPTPAADYGSGKWLFKETYAPPNGFRILSAKYAGTGLESDMLQLYSNFQSSSTNSQGLTAYTVDGDMSYNAPANNGIDSQIRNCLNLQDYDLMALDGMPAHCDRPTAIGNTGWKLCLQDANTNRNAELSVFGSSSGIKTKLDMASSCTA